MDAINDEALAGLEAAVESLLPDAADPSVRVELLVALAHIAPTGLGGFVGASQDPRGDILGRRLEGTTLATVRAGDIGPLNDAVAAVTRGFLGADRTALLQKGILRVTLDGLGPQSISGGGRNRIAERTLTFKVLYEFLKSPEEPEGVIQKIPVDLDVTNDLDAT